MQTGDIDRTGYRVGEPTPVEGGFEIIATSETQPRKLAENGIERQVTGRGVTIEETEENLDSNIRDTEEFAASGSTFQG